MNTALAPTETAGVTAPTTPVSLEQVSMGGQAAQVLMPLKAGAAEVSSSLLQADKSFRVAIAQITTDPGTIELNTLKIVEKIQEAKRQGAELVVFPEAAIPAYCSMDLQFNRAYIKDNLKALDAVKRASEGITVVVGFVDTNEDSKRTGGRPALYNSAAIIRNGEILAIQDKSLLPNYEIFFEDRYYAPQRGYSVVDLGKVKLGTTICEDIWSSAEGYKVDPSQELIQRGANLLVNLSASPFHMGKQETRHRIVQEAAKKNGVPYIYTNLVGAFDAYEGEVIFDGRSIIADASGKLIAEGKAFKEDLMVVDVFKPQAMTIPKMSQVEELYEALVLGIKDYIRRSGSAGQKAVIGISGGIDSALVAALAVDALGPDRVVGLTMPSVFNSEQTKGAAYQLARNLNIDIKTVPIQQQVDACLETLTHDPLVGNKPSGVAEENVQARMRMINLMYYANKLSGIVLNTGNKTELALNNCTIYGDMVGGFSVLGDVDKDRVYELSRYINQRHGREVIPEFSIVTPATAELKANQTDADVMGGAPEVLAPMVRDVVENNLTLEEITQRWGEKFSPEQILKVLTRLDQSEWKRRQAAPGIRVTPHAFGNGRKMPISHGYYK